MTLETYSYAFFLEAGKRITAPIIDNIADRVSKKSARLINQRKFIKASEHFLATSYQKCSCVNTIVYPGEFKKIEDIYVPLTINSEEGGESYKVDDVIDIFHHNNKVLIKDSAGMGKTTISKRVFLNLVLQRKYTPIFVELRNLKDESILGQILKMFGLNESDIDENFIKNLGFAFIFDGLDEVPHKDKQSIAKKILEFSERFSEEKILITSRDEDVANIFYSFSSFNVRPLEKNESYEVIKRISKDPEIAERLIQEIKQKKDSTIDEFLTTPLYVCLLFSVYRHRSKIPNQKHIFYANVYDALFNHHDATSKGGFFREKYSGLDSSNFEVVLRRLAFYCLRKGKVEFSMHELRTKIHEIVEKIDFISCSSQSYLKDLTETVPLFQKEGQSVRWSHKSLMEYFAASFVYRDTKDKNRELLLSLYRESASGELDNFFDIYSNEDTEGFKRTIVKEVLSDFIIYFEGDEYALLPKSIPKESLEIRKSLTFDSEIEFFIFGDSNSGKLAFSRFINKVFSNNGDDAKFLSSLKIVSIETDDENERITAAVNIIGGEGLNILPIVRKVCPNVFYKSDNLLDGESKRKDFLENFSTDKIYKVNNKKRSDCNLVKNFNAVNEFLLINIPYIINHEMACKEVSLIEESKSSLDSWIDDLI
ncbi:NB-ARC domain-containing protein [Halomonas sp. PAMB 3232]|uniref:NACHT domain-containing protein n=1 Tax=Halomonas sp. PAMB 3232 TaxID=3075221 RepID=UPI00289C6C20|nr:NB-ARC domain-containing protein [Halomonas sp. PAMB 3232]WNL38307.1 NB-ARC domain-containing protein [Halomonas sp. PAMB 3232]